LFFSMHGPVFVAEAPARTGGVPKLGLLEPEAPCTTRRNQTSYSLFPHFRPNLTAPGEKTKVAFSLCLNLGSVEKAMQETRRKRRT
jgi:hypothetical protein